MQKRMIDTCIRRAKPVITATQMLHTMIENPRPTRAEVSDIANAVLDGTDALMLSGETAYGKYPLESVKTMARVAREAESQRSRAEPAGFEGATLDESVHSYFASAAIEAAANLPLEGIVVNTLTGFTARLCAAYRDTCPLYAVSERLRTVRELALSYGVQAIQVTRPTSAEAAVCGGIAALVDSKLLSHSDLVAFICGTHQKAGLNNFLHVGTPDQLVCPVSK
jgi:pyruvate kinase